MWNIGSTPRTFSRTAPQSSIHSMPALSTAMMLPCVSGAPLGLPEVPEV